MFDHLCSWDNLYLAYRRAAKGKRGRAAAATFEYRLEDNLFALQRELQEQVYRPGAYASFTIHEPKRRLISAAPFRDRVVHHALCNVIEPLFERKFIADSYANRIGKGTHRALNRCQELARVGQSRALRQHGRVAQRGAGCSAASRVAMKAPKVLREP
ncbi:MAG: hypothetical protein ACFLMY_19520 [Candidatus Brachytrichaceae bacterium NZ_4S206]|jgi:retron-type reverse transcriptase